MTVKEVFGTDGPVAKVGGILFDVLYVNILWLLFGGPALVLILHMLPFWGQSQGLYITLQVLTVLCLLHLGPASCAAFSALGKKARKEDSYTFRDFWHSYKQNYKQAILLTLGIGLFAALLVWAIWLEVHNQDLFGKALYVVVPVQAFVAVELAFIIMYMYALLARFEMTNTEVLKYAFLMSNKHILTTLLCLLLLAGITAATFLWNLGVGLFAYGIFFYIAGLLLERVFRNYMPDEEAEEAGEDGQDEVTDDEGLKAREAKEQAKKEAEEKAKSQAEKERVAILKRYTDISETESDRDKDGR
ncbi:MAG TPA: hypothetical protein DEP00_01625 [Lachnospiraceae bacterium]|jgi:uncharacterized membrane protein YesL|nr:hypothetical protein [Lachnospiraceae bacterium]